MARLKHASLIAVGFALALALQACGLGTNSNNDGGVVRDPIVAATVNGRPIYIEDVRAHAVARGILQPTEDIDANSDAFYQALDELIERRLFSMEAEARGLDRDPGVRRQIELAREHVLWSAIADEIFEAATSPAAVERLYRENVRRLGRGEQIRVRHIQFTSREVADAAKRRLDQGERFEMLAFELSTDRNSAADGGLLGWGELSDLRPAFRQAAEDANVGVVSGPFEQDGAWHLMRVDDRRAEDAESLEALRPAIVNWLIYRETMELRERLERDARIERLREPEVATEPGGDVTVPADATQEPLRPAPDAMSPPGQAPPPFPFPMGPGGVTGAAPGQTPTPAPQQAPTAAPVTEPADPAQ